MQVQQVNCMIPDIFILVKIHLPVLFIIHHLNYTLPPNQADLNYTIANRLKMNLHSTLHALGQGDCQS
jgi:hypothetical protein